jgi:hypothetical protein
LTGADYNWHNLIPDDKPCNFLDICHPR